MTFKNLLLSGIMLILCLGSEIQAQNLTWSANQSIKGRYAYSMPIGENDEHIFTMRKEGKSKFFLTSYNKSDMNLDYDRELFFYGPDAKDYHLEKINFVGENLVVVASLYKKVGKEKEADLFAFTIDPKTGDYINKKGRLLFSIPVESKRRSGTFRTYFSPSRNLMVFQHVAYYKNFKKTKENLVLIDPELEVLAQKEILHRERVSELSFNYNVGDEGSIYFVRNNSTGSSSMVGVYDATKNFEEWSEKIQVEGMARGASITNPYLTISPDNNFVIVGTYETTDYVKKSRKESKKKRSDRRKGDTQIEGMFYLKFDGLSKEVIISKISPFKDDFLNALKTKKDEKKDRDVEMNNVYANYKLSFASDGSCIVVCERYILVEITRTDRNGFEQLIGYDHYYLEMLAFSFDKEGTLNWGRVIPKNQIFRERFGFAGMIFSNSVVPYRFGFGAYSSPHHYDYYSYGMYVDAENVYITFNDNPKNIEVNTMQEKFKYMSKPKKAIPAMAKINIKNGDMQKESGLALRDLKLPLLAEAIYQRTPESSTVIQVRKGSKYKYGIVEKN